MKEDYRGVCIRPQNRGGYWLYSPGEPNPTRIIMNNGRYEIYIMVGKLLFEKGYNKGPVTDHSKSMLPIYHIQFKSREETFNDVQTHIKSVRGKVKGNTRFKKRTLFRVYFSPIHRVGMIRMNKWCWTLKECTEWYVKAVNNYSNYMVKKRVPVRISALIGGDAFITGSGPGLQDEIT